MNFSNYYWIKGSCLLYNKKGNVVVILFCKGANMKQIRIVTDSTVDMPKEKIKEFDIEIVPLSVTIDGESYLDGVDITSREFIERLPNTTDIPKTSQPAVGTFVELYDKLDADGYDIISIHMTSGMSGTYSSAKSASELTKANVTVIDSQFISQALSFQVEEAAKMVQQGKSKDEIVEYLNEVRKNTSLYIMVDTLEYLSKGGRIGRGKALIGSLLKIKPVASLADGVYTPVNKVRTHSQFIKYIVQQYEEETKGKVVAGIGIAHAAARELADKVLDALSEVNPCDRTNIVDTTPVISTHTGPGAIAVMYYTK